EKRKQNGPHRTSKERFSLRASIIDLSRRGGSEAGEKAKLDDKPLTTGDTGVKIRATPCTVVGFGVNRLDLHGNRFLLCFNCQVNSSSCMASCSSNSRRAMDDNRVGNRNSPPHARRQGGRDHRGWLRYRPRNCTSPLRNGRCRCRSRQRF